MKAQAAATITPIESGRERKRVIRLIRVSSDQQAAEGEYGVQAQEDRCASVARVFDLDMKWELYIENVSGKDVRRSPKMKELLRIVRSGQCDGIVMSEQSRIMRRVDSELIDILEENKVKLYLPDGITDFSNPSDKLMGSVKGAFGEWERQIIRDRMVNGKAAKRRRGEWPSGANSVPYGLTLPETGPARLGIGPKIEHVKDLFELFIEGGGFTSFAELSRKTGIPYDSIDYILTNEIYTGFHVTRKTADPRFNEYREDGSIRYQRRRIIPVSERERIKMLDEAPISERQFAQAQRLLALRREMRVKVKSSKSDPYLYRGLLRCAECGRKMITLSYTNRQSNNFQAEYYVCQGAHGARTIKGTWRDGLKNGTCKTRRIRREVLEPQLDEIVAMRLGDPKFLAKVIEANERIDQSFSEERVKHLEAEIEELVQAIERNQRQYVRGKISQEHCDKIDDELQLELRASRAALDKARPDLTQITPEMWVPIARQLRGWKKLNQTARRACLTSISASFEVAGYPGKRYHETIVKIKAIRLNLGNRKDETAGEIHTEIEDDPGLAGLVPNRSRTYTARDINQSSIYLIL